MHAHAESYHKLINLILLILIIILGIMFALVIIAIIRCIWVYYVEIPKQTIKIHEIRRSKINHSMNAVHNQNIEDICAICCDKLERGVVQLAGCVHVFHETCVSEWFDRTYPVICCPICKSSATTEESKTG